MTLISKSAVLDMLDSMLTHGKRLSDAFDAVEEMETVDAILVDKSVCKISREDFIVYRRKWLYDHLEQEFDILKEVRGREREIDEQPTVDAIPVEFIEQEMNAWSKDGYEDDAESLHILIHNWRMEVAEGKEE